MTLAIAKKRGGKDSRGENLSPKCLRKRGYTHKHQEHKQKLGTRLVQPRFRGLTLIKQARDTLGAASIPRTNAHKAGLGARLCLEAGLGDHSERERERERQRGGVRPTHPHDKASDTRTYAHKGTTVN